MTNKHSIAPTPESDLPRALSAVCADCWKDIFRDFVDRPWRHGRAPTYPPIAQCESAMYDGT